MNSALFEGQLEHRRFAPKAHAFSYRMFMVWLDLDELESVFSGRWLWSVKRPALARFHRKNHLGDPKTPLAQAVRGLVETETGRPPTGPIRLLTQLSYFGYGFNPVSFYYCYDPEGLHVETVVAEVNNTPWGERHCYVLDARNTGAALAQQRFTPKKQMHVSPFMPMDVDYCWHFSEPGTKLNVYMDNHRHGDKLFDAILKLERREITGPALARVLICYPWMTLKVIVGIHWQALRLWLKKVPVHDHPSKRRPPNAQAPGKTP